MKTVVKYIFIVIIFFCCNDKDEDGCENRVSFDTEIKEFVTYLPENVGLNATEKALTVPTFQFYAVDFCKTSDKNSKGSITNFVNKTPSIDAPEDAIGLEKNISWRAEFSNNNLRVFKNENDLVDEIEVQKVSEKLLSFMTMFNSQPLINSNDFENFINNAKNEFKIIKKVNGDFHLIKNLPQGGRSETIMSAEFQREKAHAIYNDSNELQSLHTWLYKKNGSSVALESEMIQMFSPSPDSDKTVVVNKFTKYKNVVIK